MSIERISYTGEIPGIKIKATTLTELNTSVGQVGQGEIGVVDGELYYKLERNSTSFKATGGLVASGTIATAAVKTLNSANVEVIAAPGEGQLVVVDEINLFLDYNSAAYDAGAGEDLILIYGGLDGTEILQIDSDNGFLESTVDAHLIAQPSSYDVDTATTLNGLIFSNIIGTVVGAAVFVFTGGSIEDEWTDASHGYLDGDKVIFSAVGTGAPEFLINTAYYIVNKQTNIFNLALTSSGDPIEGTVDSSGTWTLGHYNDGNVNKAVNIGILSGEVATGDSPLKYSIKYRVIDILT